MRVPFSTRGDRVMPAAIKRRRVLTGVKAPRYAQTLRAPALTPAARRAA